MNERNAWFRRVHYPGGRVRMKPTGWRGWLMLTATLVAGTLGQWVAIEALVASGATHLQRIAAQVGLLLVSILIIVGVCWRLSARIDTTGE